MHEKALAVLIVLLTGQRPEPFTPRQLIGKNILQLDLKELYLLALVRTIVYRTCLSAGRYKHKNIPFL